MTSVKFSAYARGGIRLIPARAGSFGVTGMTMTDGIMVIHSRAGGELS